MTNSYAPLRPLVVQDAAADGAARFPAVRQQEATRCSLLFALEDMRLTDEGRALLAGLGIGAEQEAQIGGGLEEERLEARLRVLAGKLYDAPRVGLLARSRLAGLLTAAEGPAEMAQVIAAFQRLPQWLMESGAERQARLDAQNAALASGGRAAAQRAGSRARATAGYHSRGGRPLFGSDDEDDDEEPETPGEREQREHYQRLMLPSSAWRDPIELLDDPDDIAMAEWICTAAERQADRLAPQRLGQWIYNQWHALAIGGDPGFLFNKPGPCNPRTGQPYTKADGQRGVLRLREFE